MKSRYPHPFTFYYLHLFLLCTLFGTAGCQNRQDSGFSRSAEDALSTFELEPGFQIELVAAEPLISGRYGD
jgi:hypothetical protein